MSDTLVILSDTLVIMSDTLVIMSDTLEIMSDTLIIMSNTLKFDEWRGDLENILDIVIVAQTDLYYY